MIEPASSMVSQKSDQPRREWWVVLIGPALAFVAMGMEGVIVLSVPHFLLGWALLGSRLTAWREALIAAATGGLLGTIFMALTHVASERRYLAAAVLFGSLLAPLGAAFGASRHGYQKTGRRILIVAGLFLLFGLFVLLSQPGNP